MLYLYYGNDEETSRRKMNEAIVSLQKRAPDAHVDRITSEQAEFFNVPEILGAQGLFYARRIIVLDHVLESAEAKKHLEKHLKECAHSEHVVFILEGSLPDTLVKKITTHAQKVAEFGKKEVVQSSFNIFSLADALGKSKEELWLSYQRALAAKHAPEEIHGVLFWAVKAMLLTLVAKDAKEAGLKPFVFSSSERRARSFPRERIEEMLAELTELPQKTRRANTEMEYALESFILKYGRCA